MLETSTVSSCLTFDLGDRTPHSNATDLANHASEIVNLMTRIRPTVCKSVRQSVRSCMDCLSANQITEFYAYL